MTIIPTSADPDDFFRNFTLYVTPGEMKTHALSVLGKDAFIGTRSGNRFKLMKVYPSLLRPLLRHFDGELVQENGRLEVHGRFRYTSFGILLQLFLYILVLASTVSMAVDTRSWIPAAFGLFLLVFFLLRNRRSSRPAEKAIFNLIQSL